MKQTKRVLLLEIGRKGVEKFATLVKAGWIIIADEKSAVHIRKLGVEYISFEQVVGGSDIFSLNLLKDRILAGILSSRDNSRQMKANLLQRIEKIDMVVSSAPMSGDPNIEGFNTSLHALILSATRNEQGVTLVTDSNDYDVVVEMILKDGDTTPQMKMELVSKAYSSLAYHLASLSRIINYNLKGRPKLLPE